ncbi:Hypothetical predicted protein [Cloeon dipterum]|uniref:RING-type domain-containing protein n=1 Tax=Cloeon dipterum TaxID=197152 RepID=A0A8S1E4I5_9INSE|nr:Hypothetical predicted protein [Cloeon dipterum]
MMQNKISSCGNKKTFVGTDNDAQPAEKDMNFNLTCHRFISIAFITAFIPPALIPLAFIKTLAKMGFYGTIEGEQEIIRCAFCKAHINREDFLCYLKQGVDFAERMIFGLPEKANCKIWDVGSKNLPMRNKLNHRFEAHRLYSLLQKTDWKFVNPFSLAKSGFYYTGEEDKVRCLFCNLEVRGWEEGDTADGEHRRWNPNCPFLCSDSSVVNFPIGSEPLEEQHDGIGSLKEKGAKNYDVPEDHNNLGPNFRFLSSSSQYVHTFYDQNILVWSEPSNPRYATSDSRIKSYQQYWPPSLPQTPLKIAQAGFFYTGTGDRVVCFHCNLGLKDWMPDDDPFVQHCQWSANCQYLQMRKGLNTVLRTMHSIQDIEISNPDPPREQRIGNGDMRCFKCRNEAVSKVSLPCGHMTLCSDCTNLYCSVCETNIISEIKVALF